MASHFWLESGRRFLSEQVSTSRTPIHWEVVSVCPVKLGLVQSLTRVVALVKQLGLVSLKASGLLRVPAVRAQLAMLEANPCLRCWSILSPV